MKKNNYVAIMAGGTGSRFWPMSRTAYPKQFLDILNTGKTLLQATYDRYHAFIPNENIYIVTSEEYIPIVQQQLPQLPGENIIGEPERKNTAPCIAYISFKLKKNNPDANLIVAPSDHLIKNQKLFQHNCLQALNFTAKSNAFVTLGIKPTHPNTGYGYIQKENSSIDMPGIYTVKRFTEKPDLQTATAFVNSGDYFWNSGIFIWKVKDIISAFRLHSPELFDVFAPGLADFNTPKEKAAIRHIFRYCKSISIDYAIMEKAKNVFVIPADFIWNDLGTWNSAWEMFQKDSAHNAIAGENTLLLDSNGCMVHSTDKKLVMLGGVDDLIVVNTDDALLICKKENDQKVKDYLAKIQQTKGDLYL